MSTRKTGKKTEEDRNHLVMKGSGSGIGLLLPYVSEGVSLRGEVTGVVSEPFFAEQGTHLARGKRDRL
jgi:hypothetical protein